MVRYAFRDPRSRESGGMHPLPLHQLTPNIIVSTAADITYREVISKSMHDELFSPVGGDHCLNFVFMTGQ